MIRYDITPANLLAKVNELDAAWIGKAKTRTQQFIKAKKFEDKSPIWGDVKPIFITLQQKKCIFCERQFEGPELGTIEYDLEHFRPKSGVKRWNGPRKSAGSYRATGADSSSGYYWLAYSLDNYAASCKVCNSPLKSNYFPIAGKRATHRGGADSLKKEKQYLCYPIGAGDDDPETLITFEGTIAIPAAKSGHRRARAEVIIDFFELNSRDQLHQQRAKQIVLLGNALEKIGAKTADDVDRSLVEMITSPRMPHTACSRAHAALWKKSPAHANDIYQLCRKLVAGLVTHP
jgi:hypothetical protein